MFYYKLNEIYYKINNEIFVLYIFSEFLLLFLDFFLNIFFDKFYTFLSNKWPNLKKKLTLEDKNNIKKNHFKFYNNYLKEKEVLNKEVLTEIIEYYKEHNKLSKKDRLYDDSNNISDKWNMFKKKLTLEDKNNIKKNHLKFYNNYLKEVLNNKEALTEIIEYYNKHNKLSITHRLSDDSSSISKKWNMLKKKLTDEEKNIIKKNHLKFYNNYLLIKKNL